MASGAKRGWKLQEIVAHSDAVNCMALGHRSSRVLATGGEDRKVNLWTVHKPTCIMSLSGHTSPVECVRFGNDDESVAAGSISGVLKVWDLEAAKLFRTLAGHKSALRTLDYHPYGILLASGSLDTNIKLWDIKRKGCIFTYKDHTNAINCVRFSPDGKWLASAGEDNAVKIWDLSAGKLLADLKGHTSPVNWIEFHPKELLLATGSGDRTVRFWELENFSLISSSDGDSCSAVRCVYFHPEENCLYVGTQDILKVYGWEPAVCLDSLPMSWGKVADMSICESMPSQLIGVSCLHTNVNTFAVDVQKLAPFTQPPSQHRPFTGAGFRRSFVTDRSKAACAEPSNSESNEVNVSVVEDATDTDMAEIRNNEDYQSIFKAKNRLMPAANRAVESPFMPPSDDLAAPGGKRSSQPKFAVNQEPVAAVKIDEFVPSAQMRADQKETEIFQKMRRGHDNMMLSLSSRHNNLQVIRSIWQAGNIRNAIEIIANMQDRSVLVDMLNILNLKPSMWDLSACAILLPMLRDLLTSKYEPYIHTACQSLKVILRSFASTIKNNVRQGVGGIGIDISAEERLKKCKVCYDFLLNYKVDIDRLESTRKDSPKLQSSFREVKLLMVQLE